MTTTFFLVRHATHGLLEKKLVGRMAGISLSDQGVREAEALARHLRAENLDLVQSSPRERAWETASHIATAASLPLERADALDEIDIGEWTGFTFEQLAGDPQWQAWNAIRSCNRPPGGESMLDAQARIVGHLDGLRMRHPGGRIALVSHGDVIRSAVLHALMMPIDAYQRIEVAPGSVTTLVIGDWGAKLLSLNARASL